jgi:hypothetical protein
MGQPGYVNHGGDHGIQPVPGWCVPVGPSKLERGPPLEWDRDDVLGSASITAKYHSELEVPVALSGIAEPVRVGAQP